jgi:dihydroflavonol-4-reductase
VVALAYAHADERLLSGLRGGRVQAPVAGVRLARHRMWFDCRKAVEQLGMPQTPLEEAFRDAVDDFAAQGVLTRAV